MKRLAWFALATATLAACGDDGGGNSIDAAPDVDADETDAQDIDAVPATYSGTISLLEAQVLAPGNQGTLFGQGIQASVVFTSSDTTPGPIMEEQVGSPFGCKAWEYTPAQAAAATLGNDEGPVTFMQAGGAAQYTIPPCSFRAGAGYICPLTMTAGVGGTVDAIANNQATLTVTGTPYSMNNTSGRYVNISGAAMAANNGTFPIVGSSANNVITYVNPLAADETLPAAAQRVNLAGVGPTPGAADPGFLRDDNTTSFAHTAGGGNHFADFTVTTGNNTVGNDFTLATAEAAKLNAVPETNAAFSIVCDAAGCPIGSASGTILNIVTTDGAVPAQPQLFFVMPPPVTKRVQVRCAALQGNVAGQTITVPAAYMALIQNAGATRIQASYIRPQLMASDPVTAISGHALVGFTNSP
ncbi:MAG TPA: hypothetical protein VM261_39410 [Kofleriaceae bacterium]|nr:hypothetical protein [Kofleriaceae bacterium]